jgi:hypothetical protein
MFTRFVKACVGTAALAGGFALGHVHVPAWVSMVLGVAVGLAIGVTWGYFAGLAEGKPKEPKPLAVPVTHPKGSRRASVVLAGTLGWRAS